MLTSKFCFLFLVVCGDDQEKVDDELLFDYGGFFQSMIPRCCRSNSKTFELEQKHEVKKCFSPRHLTSLVQWSYPGTCSGYFA